MEPPFVLVEPCCSGSSSVALSALRSLRLERRADSKRQQTAIGIIVGHDPPNHDRYSYRFSINGRQFGGWAYPGDRCDFFIGERIVVYYDPIVPSENSAYDFSLVSPGGVVFIGSLLLASVFLPFFIYFQRRRRKSTAATPIDG